MNESTPPPAPNGNAFDVLLHDLKRGKVLRELNEALPSCVQAVRKFGKPGVLTLTLKIAPAKGSDATQVTVTAATQVKAPTAIPHSGIYFTTEEGGVQKNDPDQSEMQFAAVPDALPPAHPAPPEACAIPPATVASA